MCKVTTKRGENKKKSRKYYKIIPSRPYSMINKLSICIIPADLCILRNLISIQDEILFVHLAECLSVEFLLCPDNAQYLVCGQHGHEACMIFLLQLLQLDV